MISIKIIGFSGLILGILALVSFFFWASSPSGSSEGTLIRSDDGKSPQPPLRKDAFTIVTYNIGYLSGMLNNEPVQLKKSFLDENLLRVVRWLDNLKPDVVALQEIDFDSRRSYHVNQLNELTDKNRFLAFSQLITWNKRYVPFPYWPPRTHFGRVLSGMAILSRYPIVSHMRTLLGKPASNPFWYNAFYLHRALQTVTIAIGNRELVIINCHLEAYDRSERERQASVVIATLTAYQDKPLLLVGDFNTVPDSATKKNDFAPPYSRDDYRGEKTLDRIREACGLKEALPFDRPRQNEAATFTFPSNRADRKLDHIFYNNKIAALEGFVASEPGQASDHLPLVLKFRFREDQDR